MVAERTEERLAFHESMEIHELLNFKTLALAKSKLMQGLVFDPDLKALMQKDVVASTKALADLQTLYQQVPFRAPGGGGR